MIKRRRAGAAVSLPISGRHQKSHQPLKRGEKFRAQLHLTYARLPPLTEEQAFALCAADELLKAGMTPRTLMKGLGLDCAALDGLEKCGPDQPRAPAGNGRARGVIRSQNILDVKQPDLAQVEFWTPEPGRCDDEPAPEAIERYPAILALQ